MSLYRPLTELRAACVAMRDALTGQPLAQDGMTDIIARADELLVVAVKGEKVRAYLDSLTPAVDDIPEGFGVATVGGMLQ